MQWHFRSSVKINVLDKALPGLGRDWGDVLGGSCSSTFMRMLGYVTEFEAVAAQWAEDDHTMLQPTEPCWMWPMCVTISVMAAKSMATEQELCGTPLLHCIRTWACKSNVHLT
jgi:hypothetical protein